MIKKMEKYFSKHVYYNSGVHFLIGIGLGILVSRPWAGAHPLRTGLIILLVGVILHAYPVMMGKK
jgi:hypothetical protein